jgi:hypothetical protein
MMQQKRLFDSYILNYADVENLSPDTNDYNSSSWGIWLGTSWVG